jgi:hypothetical protein
MNANSATKPRMMPIKNLAKNGPVGVLKRRCIMRCARTWPWRRLRPIAHRKESRAYSLPPSPRRIASRICPDLISDRHSRSIFALVKFLSQLFAALNLLPSIATVVSVNSDPPANGHAFDGHRMRGPNCSIISSLRSATVAKGCGPWRYHGLRRRRKREGAKAGTRILRFVQDRTQTPRQVCEVERFIDDRKLVDGLMSFQHISRVARGE